MRDGVLPSIVYMKGCVSDDILEHKFHIKEDISTSW